jgi:hypothetical protein
MSQCRKVTNAARGGFQQELHMTLKLGNGNKVVHLQVKYQIHELTKEEFPMVYAFWKLNLSSSNTAQSAPGCISQKTKAEWNILEDIMFEKMEAKDFVMLALGMDGDDDYIFEKTFPGWSQDWV